MLQLYHAEWCPSSPHVRQGLTELGLDYVSRQVPAQREARIALRQAVGAETIPALRHTNGAVIVGADKILAYLGEYIVESPEAEAHRQGRSSSAAATSRTSATARKRSDVDPAACETFKNWRSPCFRQKVGRGE
jgi:glutathione S-transferase